MINLAGNKECEKDIPNELMTAGITAIWHTEMLKGEVPTHYTGRLEVSPTEIWTFKRYWYYWVCEGPALPFKYADPLHALAGKVIRVDGHCGCPSPQEWFGEERKERNRKKFYEDLEIYKKREFPSDNLMLEIMLKMEKEGFQWPDGVPCYHVDSQEGLTLLAITLKFWKIEEDKKPTTIRKVA